MVLPVRLTLDGGDMSQFKVLVVDDAPLMRMTIVNILKGDPNLKVVGKAKNGVEALKMMMSTEPDLILLDIEMPEMDGLTFSGMHAPRLKQKFSFSQPSRDWARQRPSKLKS